MYPENNIEKISQNNANSQFSNASKILNKNNLNQK